jgi:hypothetical protein
VLIFVLAVSIGMIGSVLGLTPAQIKALQATPSLVHDLALVVHGHRWKALFEDVLRHAPAEQRAEREARQAFVSGKVLPEGRLLRAKPRRMLRLGPWERSKVL